MLSEYGSKTIQLDETVTGLRTTVSERDAKIMELEGRLTDLEKTEAETREERDRLRDEMTSLSATYNNLEDEFRRVQHNPPTEQPSTAAGEDPSGTNGAAGETVERVEQAEGESPDQLASSGSTEVATLRADNSRLRENAQAADEWMQMAVERMNVMGAETGQLQQTIRGLEENISQAANVPTPSAPEREEWLRLEAQLREAYDEISQRLDAETRVRTELEYKLATASQEQETDVRNPMHDEIRLGLEQRFEQSTNEISALRQELLVLQARDEKAEEPAVTIGDGVESRDDEIERLRQSNEAAQDWMAKAVEHHQVLSDQVASLAAENDVLTNKLAQLESPPTAELQSQLQEMTIAMSRVETELQEKQQQIDSLVADHFSSTQELNETISRLSAERDMLQSSKSSIETQFDTVCDLQTDIQLSEAEASLRVSELQTEIESREAEIASVREINKELHSENGEKTRRMEEVELELEQIKSELAMLSYEFKDLEEEKELLEERMNTPDTEQSDSQEGTYTA
jgi:chromosome segregation ATPase